MIYTLSNMRTIARALLGEVSAANSHWATTDDDIQLNIWLNEGYKKLYNAELWNFRLKSCDISTVYTTVSASSSGTTLNVTSNSGFLIGDYIYIWEGSTYEKNTVSALSGDTIITVGTTLSTTFTTSGKVAKTDYPLNYTVKTIKTVSDITNKTKLSPSTQLTHEDEYPMLNSTSDPQEYICGMNYDLSETGYTADATTSATSLVDTSPLGTWTNYYKNWYIVAEDAAVPNTSRVTASVKGAGSTTMTLSPGVSTLVSGGAYSVYLDVPMLRISPIPDSVCKLHITYFDRAPDILSDYNVVKFGSLSEDYGMGVIYYACAMASSEQENDRATQRFMSLFKDTLETMKKDDFINSVGELPGFGS